MRLSLLDSASDQLSRVYSAHRQLPTSLRDLLESCSKLTEKDVPVNILNEYCSARNDRGSVNNAMTEINSSSLHKSNAGTRKINTFTYSSMSLLERPIFLSFEFNEYNLEELVMKSYNGSEVQFQTFLTDLTVWLTGLRRIIYSIKWVEDVDPSAKWAEIRVQGMMQLFLNAAFDGWFTNSDEGAILATAANSNLIEFSVTDPDEQEVQWSGYSDLKCGLLGSDILSSTANVEMKVPFTTSLFHSKGLKPKQQLLGQTIGLWKMTPTSDTPHHRLSFLTDVFALSVLYFNGKTAYLSKRVTSAREFCLRLLLMCCSLSEDTWENLMAEGGKMQVDLTDENEESEVRKDDSRQRGAVTRSQTGLATGGNKKMSEDREGDEENVMACNTIGREEEEEEAHERRLEELSAMLRWEAKCLGVQFLGSDELQLCL